MEKSSHSWLRKEKKNATSSVAVAYVRRSPFWERIRRAPVEGKHPSLILC